MDVNILGISGSPRPNGNTDRMLHYCLEAAKEIEGVSIDFVDLRGKLSGCIDCDKCPINPPQKYCLLNDKMEEIYPKLIKADGIILGSPTYFGTVTAQMKAFMDRCRPMGRAGALLRYKVGGGLAVGACRSGGQEKALGTMVDYFILTGLLPVGLTRILQIGPSGLAWRSGSIEKDTWKAEFLPEGEVTWQMQCKELGRSVAAVAKMVKAGRSIENPDNYVEGWKLERDSVH